MSRHTTSTAHEVRPGPAPSSSSPSCFLVEQPAIFRSLSGQLKRAKATVDAWSEDYIGQLIYVFLSSLSRSLCVPVYLSTFRGGGCDARDTLQAGEKAELNSGKWDYQKSNTLFSHTHTRGMLYLHTCVRVWVCVGRINCVLISTRNATKCQQISIRVQIN